MAIYHCSIKIISRGKGQSAVAAAAYRSGEKITNEYDGVTHDYTRKTGVVYTEILLPQSAPREYERRSVLWNAVEKIEKAKNSQLAREIELAMPVELTMEQNIFLVRDYIARHFVSVGMCADICVHDKKDGNPHAHVLLTMRPFEPDGLWGAKAHKVDGRKIPTVDWNDQSKAEIWRADWAAAVNAALENQKLAERVDHRSYERQGIEQVPTAHMGVAATQMERRGIATERGNMNLEIAVTNKQLRQLWARINQLVDWLKEAVAPAESTLPALRRKALEMQNQLADLRGSVKSIERRLGTLDEHIRQGEIFLQHRGLYTEYQRLSPQKQPKFFEEHRAELMTFEAAKRHLACLNGHTLPLEAWKTEREKLIVERGAFSHEYATLKEQVLAAENVRWEAERIIRNSKKNARNHAQERQKI